MSIFKKTISFIPNVIKYIIGFIFFIPYLWMIISSLKTSGEIQSSPLALPKNVLFSNYIYAWQNARYSSYFLNSVIIVTCSLVLLVIISLLAAYAFARFSFPLKNIILFSIYIGLIVPVVILIFPIYRFFDAINLINSLLGLILLYSSFGIPFSVFILRAYFLSLPKELEDAAIVDGCNRFSAFFRIIVPISMGPISAVIIFNFIGLWNEFMYAYILINTEKLKPISAGLGNFIGIYKIDIAGLFAANTIAAIPTVIIFLIFQRKFIDALTGSVKG